MKRLPEPPAHMSEDAKTFWKEIVSTFDMETHHLRLLRLACESLDRAETARRFLDENGTTYVDRLNNFKSRPEVGIERDGRLVFARLLKQLGLDMPPPPEPRRPGRPAMGGR